MHRSLPNNSVIFYFSNRRLLSDSGVEQSLGPTIITSTNAPFIRSTSTYLSSTTSSSDTTRSTSLVQVVDDEEDDSENEEEDIVVDDCRMDEGEELVMKEGGDVDINTKDGGDIETEIGKKTLSLI